MSEKEYKAFLNKYAANAERLHRIGIHSYGYDPGHLCYIEGVREEISLHQKLVEIICDLIKKAYPETSNDAEMIQCYKNRLKTKAKEVLAKIEEAK